MTIRKSVHVKRPVEKTFRLFTEAIARAQPGQAVGNEGGAIAVLAVKDIEAARNELAARRVRCEHITTIPNIVKLCIFRDPDGNRLQLSQSLMG
jgi:hypothetical protein